MIRLTVPAHIATLAAHGVVTVAVVDELPTRSCSCVYGPNIHAENCHNKRSLIVNGQRVVLHAAARSPLTIELSEPIQRQLAGLSLSERIDGLHPGCVVGSAVIDDVVPIIAGRMDEDWTPPMMLQDEYGLTLFHRLLGGQRDLSRQLAYQSFEPGKWAVILTDPAPCEKRCPTCLGGSGTTFDGHGESYFLDCPTCSAQGRLAPFPLDASGTWGVWP